MTVENFILNLRRAISEFSEFNSNKENTLIKEPRHRELRYQTAISLYQIIEFYFDTTISTDENIMTEAEIQVIIDKLNNIMDTQLYVDL